MMQRSDSSDGKGSDTTRPAFRTTTGAELPLARIARSRGQTAYVSFPPLPSVAMLPSALIAGRAGNDVIPTLLLAALIWPLALAVLRRLAAVGASRRTPTDDLWLSATLAFGSVVLFAAVQGKVWYTAHIVSLVLAALYFHAALGAQYPFLVGLCLGALMLTRPQMVFLGTFFLFESVRLGTNDGRYPLRPSLWPKMPDRLGPPLRSVLTAAAPLLLLAAAGFALPGAALRASVAGSSPPWSTRTGLFRSAQRPT